MVGKYAYRKAKTCVHQSLDRYSVVSRVSTIEVKTVPEGQDGWQGSDREAQESHTMMGA